MSTFVSILATYFLVVFMFVFTLVWVILLVLLLDHDMWESAKSLTVVSRKRAHGRCPLL